MGALTRLFPKSEGGVVVERRGGGRGWPQMGETGRLLDGSGKRRFVPGFD